MSNGHFDMSLVINFYLFKSIHEDHSDITKNRLRQEKLTTLYIEDDEGKKMVFKWFKWLGELNRAHCDQGQGQTGQFWLQVIFKNPLSGDILPFGFYSSPAPGGFISNLNLWNSFEKLPCGTYTRDGKWTWIQLLFWEWLNYGKWRGEEVKVKLCQV